MAATAESINKLNLTEWVANSRDLLQQERDAEICEAANLRTEVSASVLEELGTCLRKVYIGEVETGLYGRTLVTLTRWPTIRNDGTDSLPANKFSSGDLVGISKGESGTTEPDATGVVTKAHDTSIQIVLDDKSDESIVSVPLNNLWSGLTYSLAQRRRPREAGCVGK